MTKQKDKNDDFDDFDEVDDGEDNGGFDFAALLSASHVVSDSLAAKRAIEIARENRALRHELEDYPD